MKRSFTRTLIRCVLAALLSVASASADVRPRIVTIGGAATEIVFALDRGDDVVGVDLSSQYPESVRSLPQVGYVRNIAAEGILALEPTQIITTSDIGPENALEQIKSSNIRTTVIPSPDSPEQLYRAIETLGRELDRVEAAAELQRQIRSTIRRIHRPDTTPKVLFFMSNPGNGRLSAAGRGTKAEAVIQLAGGENTITSHPGYKAISSEALAAIQPDVILIGLPEGMPHDEAEAVRGVMENPAWRSVPAVRNQRVHTVPLGRTLGFGVRIGDAVLELNQLFVETPSE
ncbi:MAG: heme/hemin ABC transporter substrate-binding protein [Verrucomicrobiota bacterium]